jgi:hypothetical protein
MSNLNSTSNYDTIIDVSSLLDVSVSATHASKLFVVANERQTEQPFECDEIQFKGGNAILINAVRLDPTATNNIEQV